MCALTAILHTTREEADSISRRAAVLRRLAELEAKASRLREELRAYEERYGLDSRELVEFWDEALERGEALDLGIPDLDLVEWRSLWELYQEILEEVEKLRAELGRAASQ